jgi:hypothetical protein
VSGQVAAHRTVLSVVPARPEKTAIGLCMGLQSGPTPDMARHKDSIGPLRAGLLRAMPFRARAVLGPGGPFAILYR